MARERQPQPLSPMQISQMHPDDVAEYNEQLSRHQEERARRKLADDNRAAGHPTPVPGSKLYVSTARGIARRNRAGLAFEYKARRPVEVVSGDHEEILARAKAGESVVSEHGAELILADEALLVHSNVAEHASAAEANARADVAEARAAQLEEELAKVKAQARRDAAESKDGAPTRLKAAQAAEQAAKSGEFGGKDPAKG